MTEWCSDVNMDGNSYHIQPNGCNAPAPRIYLFSYILDRHLPHENLLSEIFVDGRGHNENETIYDHYRFDYYCGINYPRCGYR